MRSHRLLLSLLLLGTALLLGVALLRVFGVLGPTSSSMAQPVGRDEQEIAWIHAATNSATWERFVTGVRCLKDEWPDLHADTEHAFPEQANRVPEVVLHFWESKYRLRVRWYKLTSETGIQHWVQQLARRDPAPLAFIGGGSSDRARDLALALRNQPEWRGNPPLLLITTATADEVNTEPTTVETVPLTAVYPGRTFRFCFQNSQMAEAVLDFIWSQPDLRPAADPARPGSSASAFTIAWDDDPYSIDLANRFQTALYDARRAPIQGMTYSIPYSVGDYNEPNKHEAHLVAKLAEHISAAPHQRRLLVLPTLVQPARRILRKLAVTTPAAVRNVVAVTGDSINFNNIYRDRHVAWNGQEIPVPLVFFCHQDPVNGWKLDAPELARGHASATDDVLLNVAMMRRIVEAWPSPGPDGADRFAVNLRRSTPTLFETDGNRVGGRGEFVVCLRPRREGEKVLSVATVEVWHRDGQQADGMRWRQHASFEVRYHTGQPDGGAPDVGP